jgi:hypothetical protein
MHHFFDLIDARYIRPKGRKPLALDEYAEMNAETVARQIERNYTQKTGGTGRLRRRGLL